MGRQNGEGIIRFTIGHCKQLDSYTPCVCGIRSQSNNTAVHNEPGSSQVNIYIGKFIIETFPETDFIQ